jgi:hypothetical protein
LDPKLFRQAMVRGTVRRCAWLLGTLVVITPIFFAAASIGTPGMTRYVPAALPLTALALGFGAALNWRRQVDAARIRWDSFELVVSENVLRRTITGAPPVEILRPDVVAILERPGDGLVVVTADRRRSIVLPEQLMGFLAEFDETDALQLPAGYSGVGGSKRFGQRRGAQDGKFT